jgi:lipoprotein-anchoring transpeptidase ErfK/SrfK
MLNRLAPVMAICLGSLFLASCAHQDTHHSLVVSIPDQKMILYKDSKPEAQYDVSTSKYGIGDHPGSRETPLGVLVVAKKYGDNVPLGGVMKSRRFTGEVLPPDAPGRDPIVTRILWLKGLEPSNSHAFSRCIYIHGTPVERDIGKPASYGCIRMRSEDVVHLYNSVGVGTKVQIIDTPFALPAQAPTVPQNPQLVGG